MTYKKKLIEVAIPLAKINEESGRQKTMGAAPHPQNLHRWWARRPLAATRAVLFASLVDDPSAHPELFPTPEAQHRERKRLFDILERLIPWGANEDDEVMREAREEIRRSCEGELPNILDPFGGGGAIPLEALRLGLPTFSGDLNPVAVLIQRAMLEVPNRFADQPPVHEEALSSRGFWLGAEGLAADVDAYGRWMEDEANRRIGASFPSVRALDGGTATPIAWIWARTVRSPDPAWQGQVPLVRSWVLAKKPGKPTVWIEPSIDKLSRTITFKVRQDGTPVSPTMDRGNGTCVATGSPIQGSYIRSEAVAGRMGRSMIAVVADSSTGRAYMSPDTTSIGAAAAVPAVAWRPDELVPTPNHDVDRLPMYGMPSWGDAFTDRQLLALTTFSDLIPAVRARVIAEAVALPDDGVRLHEGGRGRAAYADAVVTYLSLAIDRCADYWSTLCSWHGPNQQIRETFSKQAIQMTWDFAEVNPFSGRMGSWRSMLKTTARSIPTLGVWGSAMVAQRDARARIAEVGRCVVATDPPYYDNISYADLSDFFYVWLRRNLRDVWPDECATLLTPKVEEMIANQYRAGSKEAAHRHFELGMLGVFTKAAENADDRYPATVFYAFKATESSEGGINSTGWETFLSGLLKAGYAVTATWPIRTEMTNRTVAAGTNALASSIVLACRRRELKAPMATRGEFVAALKVSMPPAVRLLQEQNIAPVDMAQSAMGPGIAEFSQFAKVVEADGSTMTVRTALALINEVLSEALSGEESEFDADTRFALTWFEQFGHNPAQFGHADSLAKAKNTTVEGVVRAGVAAAREGKVRLVERAELPTSWDPKTDQRLTVWETTQYLIRALESSEADAASLLRAMGGGLGDRARQLAYLLYGICDRKKWVDDASAYNMLVTAWPEIERLAASPAAGGPAERLF